MFAINGIHMISLLNSAKYITIYSLSGELNEVL